MNSYDVEELFWKNVYEEDDAMRKIVWGARTLEEFNSNTEKESQFIIENLKINKEDTVLDYGAGIGRLMKVIAPKCKYIAGIDVSNGMVALSRKCLKDVPNAAIMHCSNIGEAPIQPNSITKIYSHIVLQHINKYKVYYILKNLRHYLAPCGKAMFQFPDLMKDCGSFKDYAKVYITNKDNNCSLHFWTKEEAAYIFKLAGWSVIEFVDGTTDFWVIAE